MARKKIIGIHLLALANESWVIKCELRNGDGSAGTAIAVTEASLVTCPWCLGAKTKEQARRMVARMYAKRMEEEQRDQ